MQNYFMIISTVFNIAFDLLFILVFGWGIAGAAVATLLPGEADAQDGDGIESGDGIKKGYRVTRHVADYYRSAKI